MITYDQAREIASHFISPNSRDENLLSLAQGTNYLTTAGLRYEIEREIKYGHYDNEALQELMQLLAWVNFK